MSEQSWQEQMRDRRRSVPGCPDPVPDPSVSEQEGTTPVFGQVAWGADQQAVIWQGEKWVPLEVQGAGPLNPVAVGTVLRTGTEVLTWTGVRWAPVEEVARREAEASRSLPPVARMKQSTEEAVLRLWMEQGRAAMRAWKDSELDSPTGLPQPPAPFPLLFDAVARFVFEMWSQELTLYLMRVGFWDDERTFGDEMALLHSEVSEAVQEFREHGFETRTRGDGKPEGVAYEFADVFIRLLDDCVRCGITLPAVFREKQDFNWTRPYRHGDRNL